MPRSLTFAANICFRRSAGLVCGWRGTDFLVRDFIRRTESVLSPAALEVLSRLASWRTVHDLRQSTPALAPAALIALLDDLTTRQLVERSDQPPDPIKRLLHRWDMWGPAAAHFHFGTKDAPPLRRNDRSDEEHLKLANYPDAVKPAQHGGVVPLPAYSRRGAFVDVLLQRRSWRRFGKKAIQLGDLAALLGLTWGVQRWMHLAPGVVAPLKTSPSGGACHPIEVYLLAQRVAGLPRAVYHYRADTHALERQCTDVATNTAHVWVNKQDWFADCAALFVMTAVVERVQWKYPIPRAYRVMLLEAGHFCQTFCLVATWLGLAPFCTAALADSKIERTLGVDGVQELVVYACGVGTRPPDTSWAPFTDGRIPTTAPVRHARRTTERILR